MPHSAEQLMQQQRNREAMIGLRYGEWTVVGLSEQRDASRSIHVEVQCSCGARATVPPMRLRRGGSTCCMKCGHKKRRTHGYWMSPTYRTYRSMLQRTGNPKAPDFARYGGRGIEVCDRWRASFENFLADMGARPQGRTLDRIDNDGGYEPGNCRWATTAEQAASKSTTKLNWVGVCLMRHMHARGARAADLSHAFGVHASTVYPILARTQRSSWL